MIDVANAIDAALELPVVPSFTKIGFEARRRLFHWRALDGYALHGPRRGDHGCHIRAGPRGRPAART